MREGENADFVAVEELLALGLPFLAHV